jgi:hypothetical protein
VLAQLIQGSAPKLDDDPATIAAFFQVGITQAVALHADPGVIKTLYVIDALLTGRVFWVLLALVLPLLLAGLSGALPRSTVWLNTIVAVLFLLGGVSVKARGAFSPYGAVPFLAFLGFLAFILGTSLVLWREPASGEPRPAAGPSGASPAPGP